MNRLTMTCLGFSSQHLWKTSRPFFFSCNTISDLTLTKHLSFIESGCGATLLPGILLLSFLCLWNLTLLFSVLLVFECLGYLWFWILFSRLCNCKVTVFVALAHIKILELYTCHKFLRSGHDMWTIFESGYIFISSLHAHRTFTCTQYAQDRN